MIVNYHFFRAIIENNFRGHIMGHRHNTLSDNIFRNSKFMKVVNVKILGKNIKSNMILC